MIRQCGRAAWLSAFLLAATATAGAAPIEIAAAENVYGEVARAIGGPRVHVVSILSRPDQDPHLFEATPSASRAVAGARIVISNGLGYDPWMDKILAAAAGHDRVSLIVAAAAGRKPGDNPHLWFDPGAMRNMGRALCRALAAADPPGAPTYTAHLLQFEAGLDQVQSRVATLRARLTGTRVAATEPVFGEMFAALGLQVRGIAFQTAVMNDTEPSASAVAAFERDLTTRHVKLLIYNSQATSTTAERMRRIAQAAGIPVIGASESEPASKDYRAWMLDELDSIAAALPPPHG